MIRLTLLNGKHWYVNPDHIVGIKSGHKYGAAIESDHQTGIEHTIDVTQVQESPEEVARKVLEWKLAMERYRAVVFAEAKETGEEAKMLAWARDVEYRIMLNLAGLEEPQNAHQ